MKTLIRCAGTGLMMPQIRPPLAWQVAVKEVPLLGLRGCGSQRWLSQTTKTNHTIPIDPLLSKAPATAKAQASPLSRMTTPDLLRSIFMAYTASSPKAFSLSLRLMQLMLDSKSPLLHPDKNPILRFIVRHLIYNHFIAGTNPQEVRAKVQEIRDAGYTGVILGFTREILADEQQEDTATPQSPTTPSQDPHITSWLRANLDTLSLIGPGDYTNIKFTGAGPITSHALRLGHPPPPALTTAFTTICRTAQSRGIRVWIDAEMQLFQPTVDAWALHFMRLHNTAGEALIFNTYQAYLKGTRSVLESHMRAAQPEGWTLGVKLVRGAYLASEIRERIWDTKGETDDNYNGIVRDVLCKSWPGFTRNKATFPDVEIFLAGHNKESIRLATSLVCELVQKGEEMRPVQYGQLHGMADDVSCELLGLKEAAMRDVNGLGAREVDMKECMAPRPYKCLAWGGVRDAMGFLMRRAVENASATERMREGLVEMKGELRRRVGRAFRGA